MAVTYTFSTQSGSIPLAQLDANFATPITIGNTSVQLGNTITTLNNITLANTTISSGNVTLTNVSVTTANVTTANITNAVIGTANVTTANITSGVIATANITTGNVGTLTLTNALGTTSGGTGLSSFTANGVLYASSTSVLVTGSALTFDGTTLGVTNSSASLALSATKSADGNVAFFRRIAGTYNPGMYISLSDTVNNEIIFNTTYSSGNAPAYVWQNVGSEQMRLTGTGLGIGTSSPAQRLDVRGSIYVQRDSNPTNALAVQLTNQTTVSNNGCRLSFDAYNVGSSALGVPSDSASLAFYTGGVTTEQMRLDSSGNLGIGTSSPSFKLDVAGGVARLQQGFQVLDTDGYFAFANKTVGATGNYGFYYSGSTSSVQIWTASSQRVTIDSSGNLGLGVTPSAWVGDKALQVNWGSISSGYEYSVNVSSVAYRDNTTWKYLVSSQAPARYEQIGGAHKWFTAPSGTAGNAISFTQAMTLDTSGNLTVPAMYSTTVTTPRNVFIDSTGKMGGISSSRASKTNISQLDTADWIYELNPVTFNYLKKDEEGEYLEEFEEELQFGLIAEEVELVKPELCIYTDDKVSGIHYDRMIAPLIKAIQELKASNDVLTARIAQLEAK